jgi:hypothetical protein
MDTTYFKKLRLTLGTIPGAYVPLEKARELLTRVSSMLNATSFDWVLAERPTDGTVFICHVTREIPSDGYGWLDEEVASYVQVDNMVMFTS